MLTQGKVWGKTSPIFLKNNVEIHRIECMSGSFCSEHLHEHKFNLFFVESGGMRIVEWDINSGKESHRDLGKLQIATVKPNKYHKFECTKDAVVYEVYWAEFDSHSEKMKFIDYSSTSHPNKIIFSKDDTEFCRSEYWKGGVKSFEYNHMNSMFFVEEGEVEISVRKKDYDLVDKTRLVASQSTIVSAGETHELRAIEDSILYEFHWVELCPSDIVRRSVGGI